MITLKKIICLALLVIFPIYGYAEDLNSKTATKNHSGPPPEAFKACEDKSAGDTAQFEDPRGEIVTGTCVQMGEALVLRPDHNKDDFKGKHHGPPPEAFAACRDKEAGDTAQFISPSGDTVTGTCEWKCDSLVLHPDNLKDSRPFKRHEGMNHPPADENEPRQAPLDSSEDLNT